VLKVKKAKNKGFCAFLFQFALFPINIDCSGGGEMRRDDAAGDERVVSSSSLNSNVKIEKELNISHSPLS